uniref:Uncharacterized protein n=1 Tax=Sphaerodactylus townsendi TaxID=933632 RepID=A0ACB8EPR3_9SAUR
MKNGRKRYLSSPHSPCQKSSKQTKIDQFFTDNSPVEALIEGLTLSNRFAPLEANLELEDIRYDIKIMRFFRNTTIHRLIEDTHASPDKRNANLKEFNKATAVGNPNKTGPSSEALTKGIKELADEWKQLEMSLNEIHSSHQHILEEVEDVLRLNSAPNSVPEALGDVLCSGNSPSCPTLLAYNPAIQSYCSPDNSPNEAICVPISKGGEKLSDKMDTIEFEIDLRSTKVLQTDSTTKPKEKT